MINEKVGKGDDGKSTLSSELKISQSDPRFASTCRQIID